MNRQRAQSPRGGRTHGHRPGIAPYRGGWRIYVRLQGVYRSKLLPGDTSEKQLAVAREELRVDLRRELARLPPRTGTPPPVTSDMPFDQAAARYLPAVASLPSYTERERDIALWVAEFGSRPIATITSLDIRALAQRWLAQGPKMVQVRSTAPPRPGERRGMTWKAVPQPLAASTVNHRLRALANLWTVLFGRHAANPAREVPDFDEPESAPRAIPPEIVEQILEALPDRGLGTKGKDRPEVSQAKARLRVMAWLGLPPAQLALLRSEDVDWTAGTVFVRRRRKGKGVTGGTRQVTTHGLAALRAIHQAHAWGPFSMSTVRRAWRRACAHVEKQAAKEKVTIDLSKTRPYDLRHSFAAATLSATGDWHAVQALLGHADPRTSQRYAAAAVPTWLAAATAKLDVFQRRGGAPAKAKKKAKTAKNRAKTRRRKLHRPIARAKRSNRHGP